MSKRSYINSHVGHPHYLTNTQIQSLMQQVQLRESDKKIMLIFNHISNPTKFRICMLLSKVKELPVVDITNILGFSQSSVSHALSDLKNLGLVESHRCGQLICYRLTKNKDVNRIRQFIKNGRG